MHPILFLIWILVLVFIAGMAKGYGDAVRDLNRQKRGSEKKEKWTPEQLKQSANGSWLSAIVGADKVRTP